MTTGASFRPPPPPRYGGLRVLRGATGCRGPSTGARIPPPPAVDRQPSILASLAPLETDHPRGTRRRRRSEGRCPRESRRRRPLRPGSEEGGAPIRLDREC